MESHGVFHNSIQLISNYFFIENEEWNGMVVVRKRKNLVIRRRESLARRHLNQCVLFILDNKKVSFSITFYFRCYDIGNIIHIE